MSYDLLCNLLITGRQVCHITVKPENRELQKYFWDVVLQEKSQSGVRKLNQE